MHHVRLTSTCLLGATACLLAVHLAARDSDAQTSTVTEASFAQQEDMPPRWILSSQGTWYRALGGAERAQLDLPGPAWFVLDAPLQAGRGQLTLQVPGPDGLEPLRLSLDRTATAAPVQFTAVEVQESRLPVVNEVHNLAAYTDGPAGRSRVVIDQGLDAAGAPEVLGLAGGVAAGQRRLRVLGREAHWEVELPLLAEPRGLLLYAEQGVPALDLAAAPAAGKQFQFALIGDLTFCENNRANWAARLDQIGFETRVGFAAAGGTGADPVLKLAACHFTGAPAGQKALDEAQRCALGSTLDGWQEELGMFATNQASGLIGKSCVDTQGELYVFSSCGKGVYWEPSGAPGGLFAQRGNCLRDKGWNAVEYIRQHVDVPPLHLVQVLTWGSMPGLGGNTDGMSTGAIVQGFGNTAGDLPLWEDPSGQDPVREGGRSVAKDVHQAPVHEMGHNFNATHDEVPLDAILGKCDPVYSIMYPSTSPCAARAFSPASQFEIETCLQNDWCPRIGTRPEQP